MSKNFEFANLSWVKVSRRGPKMEELSCHPALFLEDILEVILKKLPFDELKKCRKVCRKWEEASRDLVRNQGQLRLKISANIQKNLELKEFLRQDFHFMMPSSLKIEISGEVHREELVHNHSDSATRTRNPKKFRESFPSNDSPGFKTVFWKIPRDRRDRWIQDYYERLDKEIEDIFKILGKGQGQHFFQELIFNAFEFSEADRLVKTLGSSSTSADTCSIPSDAVTTEEESCPLLLTKLSIQSAPEWFHERIFTACPNIAEIHGNSNCKLMNVLKKTSGGLTKVSGFSCSSKQDIGILGRKLGKLEELSLVVEGKVGESFMEFVQTKNESLKILELKFREIPIPQTVRLGPGFSLLIRLHLQKMSCVQENQFCLDVCFSKDTPQLKYFKLEIFSDEHHWEDLLAYRSNIGKDGRVIPQRSLTHLEMQLDGEVGRECANYLRMLFPSLTSFKITRPTEDFLRGLWQCKSIVELDIGMQYGYRRESQKIEDLSVVLFGTQQNQGNEESILNLKKLRSLSITKRTWNNDGSEIPHEVIRNGFGNMKRLAVLKLPLFSITPEANGFLRDSLPFLKELKLKVC